jgi:hypothetical protein
MAEEMLTVMIMPARRTGMKRGEGMAGEDKDHSTATEM